MDFGFITNLVQWAIWIFGSVAVVRGIINKPPPTPRLNFFDSTRFLQIIIVLGILASGLHAYLVRVPKFTIIPQDQLELVEGKRFLNETVEQDGKHFDHCTFINTRFVILGKSNYMVTNSSFYGTVAFHTDSEPAAAFADALATFGVFRNKDTQMTWKTEKDVKGFSLEILFPPGQHSQGDQIPQQ